jgi:hypothetical protein
MKLLDAASNRGAGQRIEDDGAAKISMACGEVQHG